MPLRALTLLAAATACAGWRRDGMLPNSRHFAMYLGKFCFDYVAPDPEKPSRPVPPAGTIEVTVEGLTEEGEKGNTSFEGNMCYGGPKGHACETAGQLYFLAFSDEVHKWERVKGLWDELECEERLRYSSLAIPLSPEMHGNNTPAHHTFASRSPEAKVMFNSGPFRFRQGMVEVNRTVNIVQSRRPRFWYFAFMNCGARVLKEVSFQVHAFNLNAGFETEIGVDMYGAALLESIFAALFATVSLVATLAAVRGRPLQGPQGARSRPLLFVLRVSAGLSALGCVERAIHHWVYTGDGRGLPFCGVFGSVLACAAKMLLTGLQFFVGKGWALLVSPGERMQRVMILLAVVAVMTLSAVCEIRAHYFHDMGTNFYLYESWPGLVILALNLALLGASWLMTWDTYLSETSPELRAYYRLVSLAGGVYFASLPIIAVIAGALSPWVVRKIVERVEVGSRFVATALLLVCLWPSRIDALVAARLKNRSQASLMKVEESAMQELGEVSAPREGEEAGLSTSLG